MQYVLNDTKQWQAQSFIEHDTSGETMWPYGDVWNDL